MRLLVCQRRRLLLLLLCISSKCVAAQNSTATPSLKTENGNLVMVVDEGKQVGYQVGDKVVFFDEREANNRSVERSLYETIELLQNGLSLRIQNLEDGDKSLDERITDLETVDGTLDKRITDLETLDQRLEDLESSPVQISALKDSTCNLTRVGILRYQDSQLTICDGVTFVPLSEPKKPPTTGGQSQDDPGSSCAQILQEHGSVSGMFWLQPRPGGTVYQVWCDMETDGGGWALMMSIKGDSRNHIQNDAINYPFTVGAMNGRLSTADISSFIAGSDTQVFKVQPKNSAELSWYQRAASDLEEWPIDLKGSNSDALKTTSKWTWILTSYKSFLDASTGNDGYTGYYHNSDMAYPTPWNTGQHPIQMFFCSTGGGLRTSPAWTNANYHLNSQDGWLWVKTVL